MYTALQNLCPCAVMERSVPYRCYSALRIICDACCRVPEERQHILPHKARGKAACGYIMLDNSDSLVEQKAKYLGECTVDQAEYQAIIFALDRAAAFCREKIVIWLDSEVIAGQLSGWYCLRSELIKPLFDEVKKLELRYKSVTYFHHSRGSFWARAADKLANEEYSRLQKG